MIETQTKNKEDNHKMINQLHQNPDLKQFLLDAFREGTLYNLLTDNTPSVDLSSGKQVLDADTACAIFKSFCVDINAKGQRDEFAECYADDTDLELVEATWKKLPLELKKNEQVAFHALRAMNGPNWTDIPITLHSNNSLLATAVIHGKISFENVSYHLQRNHLEIALHGIQHNHLRSEDCPCFDDAFFQHAIEKGKLSWGQLPELLRGSESFARRISHITDIDTLQEMCQHVVEVCRDQQFWRKIWKMSCELPGNIRNDFVDLMSTYAPMDVRSDSELMFEICGYCVDALPLLSRNLTRDPGFWEQLLVRNANVVQYVPHEMQLQHQDLIIEAVPKFCESRLHQIVTTLHPLFLRKRAFAKAWISAGHCLFPLGKTMYRWLRDRETSLAYAKTGGSDSNIALYYFRRDLSFVYEVVEQNPSLHKKIKGPMRWHPKVMTAAFAKSLEVTLNAVSELYDTGENRRIERYLAFLRRELTPFETFSSCILANMLSTQTVQDTGTSLTLLNQGCETLVHYKRLLADFVGIPTGKWLGQLKQAEANILLVMSP